MPGNIQQLNSLIDLFSSPEVSGKTQAEKEAAINEAEKAKQRDEMLKKERHDRAMKTFKSLDEDPGAVNSDKESGSGLTLKPLPSGSAPVTMEERERQNLLKHRASVTFNYGEFSSVAPDNRIPEPAPQRELSENEKMVNEVIGTVETNGGRIAAITGRYILNVKDGVMSYLDDAAYAVTSGNSYVMQETGEFDVRKITTNALYKTASQTAQAYYENAKSDVTGSLKDQSIGIMKNATLNKLEEYKSSASLASAWKTTNKKAP
jgi:hypothetical protein